MSLSEGQRNILNLIAEMLGRTTSTSVRDEAIIKRSGLPADEVRNYLYLLEGLELITIDIKASGADHRMVYMTKDGLEESSSEITED
jgi:predicted transcriptional regulator